MDYSPELLGQRQSVKKMYQQLYWLYTVKEGKMQNGNL